MKALESTLESSLLKQEEELDGADAVASVSGTQTNDRAPFDSQVQGT